MPKRWCARCEELWPDTGNFNTCPRCGLTTRQADGALGLPRQREVLPPHEIDRQCREFAAWLDTVSPDEFRTFS